MLNKLDLQQYAPALRNVAGSHWIASVPERVSYPAGGNDVCYPLEDDSFWYQHRNRCIVAAVRRAGIGGPFFDLGGGNGVVSAALQESGLEVVLVEPREDGVRNALARGVGHVVQGGIAGCGFQPGSLPSAGLFDVLEHIENDRQALHQISAMLANDGFLCLTVPAMPFLFSSHDAQVGHFRRYTLGALSSLLGSAGFVVRYATYLFAPLVVPLFALKSVPFRLGIRSEVNAVTKQKDHSMPGGAGGALLGHLLSREVTAIGRGERMSCGTSCLVIAQRTARIA